ncbi:cyclin-J isoform X4, partial [Sigmodon hispidus]
GDGRLSPRLLTRLKLRRLAGRAAGFHGAGGAVVARTAGCGHPPGASVQGKFEEKEDS